MKCRDNNKNELIFVHVALIMPVIITELHAETIHESQQFLSCSINAFYFVSCIFLNCSTLDATK